jgi:hypothetical protein
MKNSQNQNQELEITLNDLNQSIQLNYAINAKLIKINEQFFSLTEESTNKKFVVKVFNENEVTYANQAIRYHKYMTEDGQYCKKNLKFNGCSELTKLKDTNNAYFIQEVHYLFDSCDKDFVNMIRRISQMHSLSDKVSILHETLFNQKKM